MNRIQWILWVLALFLLQECGALKELSVPSRPELEGMAGLEESCQALDTIQSVLISKAEAILTFDNERYEVN
ncbi:MAG: hypothetical protein KAI62_07470, partial [Actinomycetia bacterium]|nr:hypothetical protein [Actinomycetes bacterium]